MTDAGRDRLDLDLSTIILEHPFIYESATRWTPVVIEVTEGELDGGAHVDLLAAGIQLGL